MLFLNWLAGLLIKYGFEWLATKIAALIAMLEKDQQNKKEAEAIAAQDNQKASEINEKSSSDEVDQAIDDSLKHL